MKKIILLLFVFLYSICAFAQQLSVSNLRCFYKINPIGIDIETPNLSWQLQANQRNIVQAAYRILVADNRALLSKNIGNVWDSKQVNTAASIQIKYNGKKLLPAKNYYWKVMVWDNKGNTSTWSSINHWQMGLLKEEDWQHAQWIAYAALPDSNKIIPLVHGSGKKEWGKRKDILPLFRKTFVVPKTVKQATLFIAGLGQFEASINGKKIGDHFLDPGWTLYNKQALYVSFDVSNQLQNGNNAIGVQLGNGFYYIPGERYRKLTGAFGYPKMICRLIIKYTDGTTQNIISDESWATSPSPIIFSSIYGGEDYDANLEQNGWNTASFNDATWTKSIAVNGPSLQSQLQEPLKIKQIFTPVKKIKLKEGVWVFDVAQNMSGIPQITVQGKKGDTIKITTAELLNADGTPNQKASGRPSYYQYILKGNSIETWQPRFTYYGYRYIQIENVAPQGENNIKNFPIIISVKGLHTSNDAERVGSFTSSFELFNKTDTLIDWAIKSNMVSVFTDCPHREKLGWLEQNHLVGSSIKSEYNIATLCRKVLTDMRLSQNADGLMPEIAPEFVHFDGGFLDSPEWGSACIILSWYIYQWYGDQLLLEENYNMMQRYISYLQSKAKENILTQGLSDWYDIGPKAPGVSQLTTRGITATATYYYDLTILTQIATLLNKHNDAEKYKLLGKEVKAAFNKNFLNDTTKQYGTGSQTANAIAVFMKLVDEKDKAAIIENIIKDIRSHHNALTAGDIGYRYLLKVLDDAGRSDVIFDMNSRSDVPGYGYQLAHGATALTESWQALPSSSNNHFMLGHIMEWFYEGLAGISQSADAVAFNKIVIRPQVVGNITHAKASYQSPYGLIVSDWKNDKNIFELKTSIPANTSAWVYLPAANNAIITESGKLVEKSSYTFENGKAVIAVGSGNYHFIVK